MYEMNSIQVLVPMDHLLKYWFVWAKKRSGNSHQHPCFLPSPFNVCSKVFFLLYNALIALYLSTLLWLVASGLAPKASPSATTLSICWQVPVCRDSLLPTWEQAQGQGGTCSRGNCRPFLTRCLDVQPNAPWVGGPPGILPAPAAAEAQPRSCHGLPHSGTGSLPTYLLSCP